MEPKEMNDSLAEDGIRVYAVGDIRIDRDDPPSAFALCAPALKEADIAFCQLETNLSERGSPQVHSPLAMRAYPKNVSALTFAGFDIVSFASNHCLDFGPEAFEDTINLLRENNIQVVGVGMNITEARKPVVFERKGTSIAFLAYNSILPFGYAAEADKCGCAPIRVFTVYEPYEAFQPGTPCRVVTAPNYEDMQAMREDIKAVRSLADIVIVSMHWGLHIVPGLLAMYEKQIGHAAIDAGADLILGHHAHVLKGIEVYNGKVIFHSLGNFALDLPPYAVHTIPPSEATPLDYAGVSPDYRDNLYPVQQRMTIIVKCLIRGKLIERVSFLPVFANDQSQPEVLPGDSAKSRDIFDLMDEMSRGLGSKLSFEGDEVLVSPVS